MPTVIRTDRLFDGTGSAPYAAEVVIDGERIVEVSRSGGTVAPEGAAIITLEAGTLLPGLIDAHVHLVGSGEPGDNAFGMGDLERSISTVTLHLYKNALKNLEAGVTTVRDCVSRYYADTALRNMINRGSLPGPRIWACGLGITSTAGHMDREKVLPPHLALPGPHAAAEALDFPDVGRIAPDCYADLVFVAGDPLADITILQDRSRTALVMKGGAVVADRRAAAAVPAGNGVPA